MQDVAAGLEALPPGLSNCLEPEVMTLLLWLEAVTQVKFCYLCYHPGTNCRCSGLPPLAFFPSWSQIAGQTAGYGTTYSGVMTTPSTSLGSMSGLVPPPPGISIWDPSPWETLLPQQPVTTLTHGPPIGRGKWLKAVLSMKAPVPQFPHIAPAICQPLPFPQSQPATPYQQMVQPLVRTLGQESVLTPLPPSLLPLAVRTLMCVEDQLAPATPGEDGRHPPSGRPVRCLIKGVDAPLGPPLKTP